MSTRCKSLFVYLSIALGGSVNFYAAADDTDRTHKDACGNNQKAKRLAQLIINDPLQQRSELRCSRLLSKIALGKAK